MACLALSLQPTNGRDIMLQTREWFPPSRALAALSAFRQTRLSQSSHRTSSSDDLDSSLGDDPLAASSGQVIVGVESKYRVIYRLVNSIYVLGVTTADDHSGAATNAFDCINTVNQAVSVVVAACRGVDVVPEKIYKKYPEVYMALDIVLRGAAGAVRLAAILAMMHGDNIAKLVSSAPDAESRVRGADTWSGGHEVGATERKAAIEGFAAASFELPAETLAAGDEVASSIAPQTEKDQTEKDPLPQLPESDQTEKDPFAASEKLNKPEETLMGGFRKTAEQSADATSALAGLEVSSLPPAEATKPTFVSVEGFEGDYGGIEFAKEEAASLNEAFEGFNTAFGGGLDASEFVTTVKTKPRGDVTGLELLASGGPTPAVKAGTVIDALLAGNQASKEIMTLPELSIHEEVNAEFDGSVLKRVGLTGTVFLKTVPGNKETEFSFKLEGKTVIKRAALKSGVLTSLQEDLFHIRTGPVTEPVPVLKFSVQPKLTFLPIRARLLKRHVGKLLSIMIQYAANPNLPAPLTNVTFVVKLPSDPSLLNVSPKGVLNREERTLSWHVSDLDAKGIGKFKARMPVELDSSEGELKVVGSVRFSGSGLLSLSGIGIRPASETVKQFNEASCSYESGSYVCI